MKDYPYIRAWGQYMGSKDYYITEQVRRARETSAPPTAIFERHTGRGDREGKWAVYADIANPQAVQYLDERVPKEGA